MSSGYEIRLELLKMSKDLHMEQYYRETDHIRMLWENQMEDFRWARDSENENIRKKYPHPENPEFPKFPTEKEIIAKAEELNKFINKK